MKVGDCVINRLITEKDYMDEYYLSEITDVGDNFVCLFDVRYTDVKKENVVELAKGDTTKYTLSELEIFDVESSDYNFEDFKQKFPEAFI